MNLIIQNKLLNLVVLKNIRAWLYKEFVYSVPYIETLLTKSTIIDDVFNIRDIWSDIWPSDGLVITSKQLHRINNKIIQDSQAFKFKSETAQTEIINVEWNMSKTRYAIPRIKVKPVQLSGTTVQYCTGYNAKYIADNHVGVGSIVEIEKRGEIIPNINKIIAVNGNWEIPQFCPHCDCELQWEGVHLVCKNTKCNNSVMQDTMIWTNIIAPVDNLGELLKEKFFIEIYDSVPSIETLMFNKPTAYQNALEGTQTHRMKQMLDKLFSDESINLVDAIKALNIPRFGDVNADKLAQYPEQVKTLMNLACDGSCADGLKLASLFEEFKTKIGDANTESIKKHMDKVARLRFIQKRIDWSEQITEHPSESKGKVAITGKLSIKRSEFEKELKSAGYSPAEISKDTKFLITDNPNSSSSKNKKADAWGIVKISEQQFRKGYM